MSLSIVLFCATLSANGAEEKFPEQMARVNDVVITRVQFESRLAQSRSMNPALFDHMPPDEKSRAMLRVLNGMIQRELEVQEARRRGVTAAEQEVARLLADLEATYANKGGFKQALTEFQITLEQWKEETRRNLLIQQLEQSEYSAIPVSDEDIRQEFLQSFWQESRPPTARELDEHREHMRMVIRQRRWTERRREWMRALADTAQIWRWTPSEVSKNAP